MDLDMYRHKSPTGGCEKGFKNTTSEETKRKIGNANRGKIRSKLVRQKISNSCKGINLGEKNGMYGKKLPQHVKEAVSKFQKGRIKTEDHKKKIGKANKGKNNGMYGKNAWDKVNKIKKTCIHCGIITNTGNYGRWHGEKCKYRNK